VEAAFCWLTLAGYLDEGWVPPHVGCSAADPGLPRLALAGVGTTVGRRVRSAMSSSYAFGGSNISIIMSAPD
jgi:3-oxoacyl-[acyl-carrier-protein] synthase-1